MRRAAGAAVLLGVWLSAVALAEGPPPEAAPSPAPSPSPGVAPAPTPAATPTAAPAPAAVPAASPSLSPAASPAPTPSPTPSPSPGPTPAAAPAPPPADRISFEMMFPAERGGGKASGSAGSIEYQREDFAVASGGVEIKYQDYDIKADLVTVDVARKLVHAQGHVVIDQGPRRLTGDSSDFDLAAKTGKVMNATAYMDPDYYFTGKEIDKTGENTYAVTDGTFTSCSGVSPAWSFKMKRARVELDGYAHIYQTTMRVKRVPILYWPYIVWPALRDRASGLLVPGIGYSKTRGGYLGMSYYQVLGRSYDTTIFADGYSKGYYGVGDEFRYAPSQDTHGQARAYVIRDPTLDKNRWKVSWDHETNNLFGGMRAVVSYLDYSDFNYPRDFERSLVQSTQSQLRNDAFLTGSWGAQSLNLVLEDLQRLATPTSIIDLRKLPEVQYRVRPLELGKSPLYFGILASADYLSVDRGSGYQGKYTRLDAQPDLSLPLSSIPWLSLSVDGGGRVTAYGKSAEIDPVTGAPTLNGGSLTLAYPTGGAQLVGPSFSRIFDTSDYKLKHVIEPRWTYAYSGSVSQADEAAIPFFDNLDQVGPTNTGSGTTTSSGATALNTGTFTLTNRLLAKPKDPSSTTGTQEVVALDLLESYSFDKNQPLQFDESLHGVQRGPLIGRLRVSPGQAVNMRFQANYDTVFKTIASTQLSGDVRFGASTAGLTWFANKNTLTGLEQSNQAGVYGAFQIVPNRLRVNALVSYDIHNRALSQDNVVVNYTGQCWGFRLEYRNYQYLSGTGSTKQQDWRFSVTLKNVGTFLDIGGGDTALR